MTDYEEELYENLEAGNWDAAHAIVVSEIPGVGQFLPCVDDGDLELQKAFLSLILRSPEERPYQFLETIFRTPEIPAELFQAIALSLGDLGETTFQVGRYERRFTALDLCLRWPQVSVERTQHMAKLFPRALLSFQGDRLGQTPIGLALERSDWSDLEIARLLNVMFRECPEAMSLRDSKGRNYLHLAVKHESSESGAGVETVRELVRQRPEMVGEVCSLESDLVRDRIGDTGTPLHSVAASQNELAPEWLRILLSYAQPDDLTKLDREGRTALHVAAYERSKAKIALLLDAMPGDEPAQVMDSSGRTPLDSFLASLTRSDYLYVNDCRRWVRAGRCAWMLLTGLPIAVDPPLQDVIRHPNFPMEIALAIFLARQVEVKETDDNGDLPLHALASRDPNLDDASEYTRAVKVLIDLYPDACRVPNAQHQLPLEVMARAGHSWDHGIAPLVHAHPGAVNDLDVDPGAHIGVPALLAQLTNKDEDMDPLFRLVKEASTLITGIARKNFSVASSASMASAAAAVEDPMARKMPPGRGALPLVQIAAAPLASSPNTIHDGNHTSVTHQSHNTSRVQEVEAWLNQKVNFAFHPKDVQKYAERLVEIGFDTIGLLEQYLQVEQEVLETEVKMKLIHKRVLLRALEHE